MPVEIYNSKETVYNNQLPLDIRQLLQAKREKKEKKEASERTVFLQKHYSAKDGILAEAVLIGGVPYFLVSRATNPSNIEIQASLEFADEILKPSEASSYNKLPYSLTLKQSWRNA